MVERWGGGPGPDSLQPGERFEEATGEEEKNGGLNYVLLRLSWMLGGGWG